MAKFFKNKDLNTKPFDEQASPEHKAWEFDEQLKQNTKPPKKLDVPIVEPTPRGKHRKS